MKTYMLLNGLRWSRNSGSILCNTLKKWCFRTAWGGKYLIVNGVITELKDEYDELKDYKFFCFNGKVRFFKIDIGRFVEHHANY